MPGPLRHLSLRVVRPRILSVCFNAVAVDHVSMSCPVGACVLSYSQSTPQFYKTVEVEDIMIGGVLHAHGTKIIHVASKETSGDSVNIENIRMLLLLVETQFMERMTPFCIMLVVENRFFGSDVN